MLHEPIRIFLDTTNRLNAHRDRPLEELLPLTDTLKAMGAYRNNVFHVPQINTDPYDFESTYWKRLRDDAVDWPKLCRQLLKYVYERSGFA